MQITSDFPGGNILVESISDETVRLRQDLRDTYGEWFYWHFAVSEAAGRTVVFEFVGSVAIGTRGPAWSSDRGLSWQWLGPGERDRFVFSFPADVDVVHFSVTIPYAEADWRRFLTPHAGSEKLRAGELCLSRKGREVEMLTFGCVEKSPTFRVVLSARHHCCETTASFALEGLVDYVIVSDESEAGWLRAHVEFVALPFLDKDGVEDGDQGKNRRPRDHNRDYGTESLYPETAAVKELFGSAPVPFVVALDLHCPWLYGGLNEMLYLVGSRDVAIWEEQRKFGAILERCLRGPLPFRSADSLPFGQEWNVAKSFEKGIPFADWAGRAPGIRLAATIEVPYASARGVEVNAETARAFGADLGRALAGYLRQC